MIVASSSAVEALIMIVDIYTHIFPDRFFQELERGSPKLGNMGKRLRNVRKLFDLDLRFKDMDEIGDYR
jgi:aminocarboxymuconate-semialdehyde decarboxylase